MTSSAPYRIFTDATLDLTPELLQLLPELTVIPMQVELYSKEEPETYLWESDKTVSSKAFYQMQRKGFYARTSQITPYAYTSQFEPFLKQGTDVIYFSFSSGMSGCFQAAQLCQKELSLKYPERRIICIDTLCGSVGLGFFVWEAILKQRDGLSIDELASWAENCRSCICHWFTVDTFEHLRHGGRVSPAAAALGTVLNIKPMLHIDATSRLQVAEKPRGSRKAMSAQLKRMAQGWMPEISRRVIIGHADCIEDAERLRELVLYQFPDADIYLSEIGPVIGAHTGPGMLALIYWGENR